MITIPVPESLLPQWIDGYACYPSDTTDLVKVDLLFEAGSAYQPQLLCALAANKLFSVASEEMDSTRTAEFMDYRGVVMETNNEVHQSTLTVYMLHRFAGEVLPVVGELLRRPAFDENDFAVWCDKQRQEIAANEQRTSSVARKLYYETLFGAKHPLGWHATVADVDKLDLATVRAYYRKHYRTEECRVVLSGRVDEEITSLVAKHIGRGKDGQPLGLTLSAGLAHPQKRSLQHLDKSVQTTLRIGRVLPLCWDDPDYARLMLLTTLLGGYFGSRLMSNLREDKGYTYGIYSRMQIYRGCNVFYITTDVANDMADNAEKEIMRELERLDSIDEEELLLVKQVMAGDFVRSVDGVFERSERYCNMLATGVTEQLTANLREAVNETTAAQLQELARRLLNVADMTVCRVGV